MTSPANHARDQIFEALQADTSVTGFIPAARIFPNKAPSGPPHPYARFGPLEGDIERLSGWRGARLEGAIHVFVGESSDIPDPESFASDAVDAIATAIDGLGYAFADRTMVMPDKEEGDVYHGVVFYRYDAVEAV